jgi:hypothetical protein
VDLGRIADARRLPASPDARLPAPPYYP